MGLTNEVSLIEQLMLDRRRNATGLDVGRWLFKGYAMPLEARVGLGMRKAPFE